MIDLNKKYNDEYFSRLFENVIGHTLVSVNKNVSGKLVLTFEDANGITIDKHIAPTPMGGINIKEV